jgi:CRISPR-associated protein Cmr1
MIMETPCKSLTPLWTGDIDRDSPVVHETSLIGSLRWWYRQIQQAAGEDVCNLSSDNGPCPRQHQPICPVCQLFGCTGRSRRFRLEVSGLKAQPLFFATHPDVYVVNGNWLTTLWRGIRQGRGQEATYTLNRQALYVNHLDESPANFTIKIIATEPGDKQVLQKVHNLLAFLAQYGALGARSQNGFGQIALIDGEEFSADFWPLPTNFFSVLLKLEGFEGLGRYQEVQFVGSPPPGFKDPFKAPFIPCAFDLRYKTQTRDPRIGKGQNIGLRPFIRDWKGAAMADILLGKPRGEKWKSRIHVSHLFRQDHQENFYLKVFGFIPSPPNDGRKKDWPNAQELKTKIIEFFTGPNIFPRSTVVMEYPAS